MEDELPSAAQIRAARALLGWSQQQLAEASGRGKRTIAKFELGEGSTAPDTLVALKLCLEAAGVSFFRAKQREGVHHSIEPGSGG